MVAFVMTARNPIVVNTVSHAPISCAMTHLGRRMWWQRYTASTRISTTLLIRHSSANHTNAQGQSCDDGMVRIKAQVKGGRKLK
eukprot:COSAG05_NODE_347_length_10963_cov_157.340943_5_plen_84_part_00